MGGKRYSQLFCDGLLMAQRVNHDGGVPILVDVALQFKKVLYSHASRKEARIL